MAFLLIVFHLNIYNIDILLIKIEKCYEICFLILYFVTQYKIR